MFKFLKDIRRFFKLSLDKAKLYSVVLRARLNEEEPIREKEKEIRKIEKILISKFIDGDLEKAKSLLQEHASLVLHHDKRTEKKADIMISFRNWAYWEYARKKILEDKDCSWLKCLIDSNVFNPLSTGKYIALIISYIYNEKDREVYHQLIKICIDSQNIDLNNIFIEVFTNSCSIMAEPFWKKEGSMRLKTIMLSLEDLIESKRVNYNQINKLLNQEYIGAVIAFSKDLTRNLEKIKNELPTKQKLREELSLIERQKYGIITLPEQCIIDEEDTLPLSK